MRLDHRPRDATLLARYGTQRTAISTSRAATLAEIVGLVPEWRLSVGVSEILHYLPAHK